MTEGLDLTFEHIDWADIVDAEQSGDQEAIQELMDRSLQLRREKSQELTSPTVLPFEEYLNTPEEENKKAEHNLNSTPSISAYVRSSNSYADIARGHKRTLDERSPVVDVSTKRPAVFTSPVMQTPVVEQTNSPMETSTPDNDRPLKVAAQRRLFDRENPLDENSPPCTNQQIDPIHRQTQRQKQIDFGKKTIGYTKYIQMVPKWQRGKDDPQTPDKRKNCSTRSWQGQIRVWRRALHRWDPVAQELTAEDAAICGLDLVD